MWDLKILDAIESMECRAVGAPVTAVVTGAATGVAHYLLTDGKSGWVPVYAACIAVGFVFILRFLGCPVLRKLLYSYGWWRAGHDDR